MTTDFLYNFISKQKLAVVSSISSENIPQSAVVGIAVAPDLRIIFDTVTDSRKYKNLTANNITSLVIGWDGESTVQLEGYADVLLGEELEYLREIYFQVYPDGIKRYIEWPNIVYFCVRPKWIRYSDFSTEPPNIMEINL